MVHRIAALALVSLIAAYSVARAADESKDDLLPFKMAIVLSAPAPDGKQTPLGAAVVKDGFATMDECMSKKGVDSPSFHKLVAGLVKHMSAQTGVPIKAAIGCIDSRKLKPKDDSL